MTRPSLLVVTTVASTLEAFLVPYARRMREKGWRVDAMASGADSSDVVRDAFDGAHTVTWTRDPRDVAGMLRAGGRVREVVAAGGYDVVHVHTPVAGFVARHALRGRGSRPAVIYTAHGLHFGEGLPAMRGAAVRAAERLAARWTDFMVVINDQDLASARSLGTIPTDRVRLMHGIGIDVDRHTGAAPASLHAEVGAAEGDRIVLMIAELAPRKRPQDAIAALAGCAPHVHLVLAGEGRLDAECRALSARLGVADRVHFLGFRHDVPALIAASDAVVLCSAQEGLPRAVMEAMASGKPVVGTDVRGTRDLLADGAGLLVPVGDVTALTAALSRVLEDREFAAGLGETARERVAGAGSPYALERILLEHERLYAEALETIASAPRG